MFDYILLLFFDDNFQLLHAKYVKLLLLETTKQIKKLPNVLEANLNISKQITICGKHELSSVLIFDAR